MFSFLIARHFLFRVALLLTLSVALLLPSTPLLTGEAATAQSAGRAARPRPGKPEGVWPNLEDVKTESQLEREALPPIPSTVRSKNNSGKPWDGRRVGDPVPSQDEASKTERGSAGSDFAFSTRRITERRNSNQTRRAHAHVRFAPPLLADDQFVQNFFTWALVRNASSNENTYWYDQLRVAYGQGQESLKLAAIEFGRTGKKRSLR